MKALLAAFVLAVASSAAFAQEGALVFNNRVGGVVDAPVNISVQSGKRISFVLQ